MAGVQAGATALASFFDGTFFMGGDGRGFSRHYAVWTLLVTDPALLLITAFCYRQFMHMLARVGREARDVQADPSFMKLLHNVRRHLQLRTNARWVYLLLIMIGVMAAIVNWKTTVNPVPYFGNDVFDGADYPLGSIFNKMNLMISWALVYPTCTFFLITMSISFHRLLRKGFATDAIRLNHFHPDGFFGFRKIYELNVLMLLPYVLIFAFIFSLSFTHERSYPTLIVGQFTYATIFAGASIFTLWPLTNGIRRKRDALEDKLAHKQRRQGTLLTSLEVLLLRSSMRSALGPATPVIMNGLRITPLALSVISATTG